MARTGAGWRWLLPVAAIAVALSVSYGAYRLAGWSWDQVVSYRSPFTEDELPAAEAGDRLAGRLVLVIIDGLRDDASREMQSFDRLRAQGADVTLIAGQPSLSFPTWTTILSGAPQQISGVTTNWFEERVPVETLLDTAITAGRSVGVAAPTSFETLYGAKRAQRVTLMDWEEEFLSGALVDAALRIEEELHPDLLVVHLPDIDEAGHGSGAVSEEYRRTAARVDEEITRLVEGTQDPTTAYAVVADHGHIDSGGHGGWEPEVVRAPAVLAGDGIKSARMTAGQEDLAPTLAVLLGVPVPRHSMGVPLSDVFVRADAPGLDAALAQRTRLVQRYVGVLSTTGNGVPVARPAAGDDNAALDAVVAQADAARESRERLLRLREALPLLVGALIVLGVIALASRTALLAAVGGTAAYYVVYNAMYFLLHGYRWSLSSFNSESKIDAFFSGRMLESGGAGLVAALVAGLLYAVIRRVPFSARGRFLPGWLALGPVTVLTIQATLALQAAWFLWWWGATVTWRMPDFGWAFKYDLDLIQATALGAAAVLSPLVTLLVGRYHPRVRRAEETRRGTLDPME